TQERGQHLVHKLAARRIDHMTIGEQVRWRRLAFKQQLRRAEQRTPKLTLLWSGPRIRVYRWNYLYSLRPPPARDTATFEAAQAAFAAARL
ncbi:MAG TPA: hypothetical protein VIG30_14380, partial [Ktedonobacterales bacterium]